MRSFAEIQADAAALKGGEAALAALMPRLRSREQLLGLTDDRWLADMTKRVFQAGFSWKVIENKWPGFEEAFNGFDPHRWVFMNDDDFDALTRDKRIVRNGQKIATVRDNAIFLLDLAKEHGSAAAFFADHPVTEFHALLLLLKKRGSRLGGATATYLMRGMGRDGYILSRDVLRALQREGVIDGPGATSQKAMRAVQEAFNTWHAESNAPLAHISRTLAATIPADPADIRFTPL